MKFERLQYFIFTFVIGILFVILPLASANPRREFSNLSDFRAEDEYLELLASMPLELESGGGKILKKKDGTLWIVAVGITEVRDGGSAELIRRRTVGIAKAQAKAVALLNGEKVLAVSVLDEVTATEIEDGKESVLVEETLTESVIIKAKGVIKGMPLVASWMDKTSKIAFFAIGKQIK